MALRGPVQDYSGQQWVCAGMTKTGEPAHRPALQYKPARKRGPATIRWVAASSRVADFTPHAGKAFLHLQLLAFHPEQRIAMHGQYTKFRIAYLAVQLLVVLIKAAKLGIRLHHGIDVIFLLVFKHGATSSCVGNA
jgi:hypothetical protein